MKHYCIHWRNGAKTWAIGWGCFHDEDLGFVFEGRHEEPIAYIPPPRDLAVLRIIVHEAVDWTDDGIDPADWWKGGSV